MILWCIVDFDCLLFEYGFDLLGVLELCIWIEIEIGIWLVFKNVSVMVWGLVDYLYE